MYAALLAPGAGAAAAIAGAAGVALFLAGIVLGRLRVSLSAAGLVAMTYVAALLIATNRVDEWAPLVAVGLLSSAELASLSIDSRRRGRDDLGVHLERLRSIAVVLAAALGLAALVQGAATFGTGGTVLTGLAPVAVLLGVAAFCMLMWRSWPRPRFPSTPERKTNP
jgi:hypothetical protein